MKYLRAELGGLLERIGQSRRVLFLSDFDGTLAPIVEKPEMACLPEITRQLLQKLSRQSGVTVGIVSGRALSDLKKKVDLDGVVYAGNHGFEIEGPGISFVSPIADEIKPVFRVLRGILSMTLASFRGVQVEDKGLTMSVHYRQAQEDEVPKIQQIVENSLRSPLFAGRLRVSGGKKVLEVKPAVDWNKGKAIRLLMKRFGKGGRQSGLWPIYLGDDLTDEDGFKVIAHYGEGMSIRVGADGENSAAGHYVESPGEVPLFLSQLIEARSRESQKEIFLPEPDSVMI